MPGDVARVPGRNKRASQQVWPGRSPRLLAVLRSFHGGKGEEAATCFRKRREACVLSPEGAVARAVAHDAVR